MRKLIYITLSLILLLAMLPAGFALGILHNKHQATSKLVKEAEWAENYAKQLREKEASNDRHTLPKPR